MAMTSRGPADILVYCNVVTLQGFDFVKRYVCCGIIHFVMIATGWKPHRKGYSSRVKIRKLYCPNIMCGKYISLMQQQNDKQNVYFHLMHLRTSGSFEIRLHIFGTM